MEINIFAVIKNSERNLLRFNLLENNKFLFCSTVGLIFFLIVGW